MPCRWSLANWAAAPACMAAAAGLWAGAPSGSPLVNRRMESAKVPGAKRLLEPDPAGPETVGKAPVPPASAVLSWYIAIDCPKRATCVSRAGAAAVVGVAAE